MGVDSVCRRTAVRAVDKGLFHCAKWLHTHGYASFYGCYDEDIGFDEPEESGLLWQLLPFAQVPPASCLHRVRGLLACSPLGATPVQHEGRSKPFSFINC
jgi:hypothetical protein